MKIILDVIGSLTVMHVILYWACFFVVEKLVLFAYKHKADSNPKAANWLLLNYWQFFGGMIPFIWLVTKTYYDIGLLDIPVVVLMSLYYGLIKPGVLRKGALIYW